MKSTTAPTSAIHHPLCSRTDCHTSQPPPISATPAHTRGQPWYEEQPKPQRARARSPDSRQPCRPTCHEEQDEAEGNLCGRRAAAAARWENGEKSFSANGHASGSAAWPPCSLLAVPAVQRKSSPPGGGGGGGSDGDELFVTSSMASSLLLDCMSTIEGGA